MRRITQNIHIFMARCAHTYARRLSVYAVLLLAGCTFINEDISTPLNFSEIDLREGHSHYRDALEQLGPPTTVSSYENGVLFLYEYTKTKEIQLGLSVNKDELPWLSWFKLSLGRGYADRQAILMIFDDQGILRILSFDSWERNLGGGSAIQIFFSVHKVVDTSMYYVSTGPNQWGMTLLRPLPETLNARQSLDTGANGLELTNTPVYAGQHTLEMR